MTTQSESTVIDTPEGIRAWVFFSRMMQLALEINTGMKSMKMPILKAMFLEGLTAECYRGTKANKVGMLRTMVNVMQEDNPGWKPGTSIARALSDNEHL